MDHFSPSVLLSDSRRPILLEEEQELAFQADVTIYEGDQKTKYIHGVVFITTHRLIWMDSTHKLHPISLSLSVAVSLETSSGGGLTRASPKVHIELSDRRQVRLSCKSGGHNALHSALYGALRDRAWERRRALPPGPSAPRRDPFDPSRAGVGGLMRAAEERKKETDTELQQAFSDLSALIDNAKGMVALAERFVAKQQKQASSQEEDNDFRSMMISMGIAMPVTKGSAGSLYHSQLAAQISDWLLRTLGIESKFGGMMALTDLYCFVNRARGTQLISPDDLYRACMLFEPLRLPVRLRRFDSGVLVVHTLDNTDQAIAKSMRDLVLIDGPQTAFDVARSRNVSIALATEQLLAAERLGALCRDETLDGVVFYLNVFTDATALAFHLRRPHQTPPPGR
eukprot:TRINITY_DN15018_c0_g1_i1.p1 TRINITY_DN15018_c0_g1~~TRINITY_DN15018_c0_g1_i1.p1  ORF type:complete len:416 (-),score=97.31 TRINITY_DN15018_c0_g1_i1:365-1558(-)